MNRDIFYFFPEYTCVEYTVQLGNLDEIFVFLLWIHRCVDESAGNEQALFAEELKLSNLVHVEQWRWEYVCSGSVRLCCNSRCRTCSGLQLCQCKPTRIHHSVYVTGIRYCLSTVWKLTRKCTEGKAVDTLPELRREKGVYVGKLIRKFRFPLQVEPSSSGTHSFQVIVPFCPCFQVVVSFLSPVGVLFCVRAHSFQVIVSFLSPVFRSQFPFFPFLSFSGRSFLFVPCRNAVLCRGQCIGWLLLLLFWSGSYIGSLLMYAYFYFPVLLICSLLCFGYVTFIAKLPVFYINSTAQV